MPFEFQAVPALRAAAWVLALALGLAVLARRRDAAGRAFAFWAVVWAGGIQLLLSLQSLATDAPTQALLYRVAYYAILFSSSAFVAVLLYVPERLPHANRLLAGALAVPTVGALLFAGDHGAFLVESVSGAGYGAANTGAMAFLFPAAVWTGFLAAMLWLGWRAPRLDGPARASAVWLMAGLGLFAADRFGRTAMLWVRDPATLGAPPEGLVYGLFMLAFGAAVAWMVWRTRGDAAASPLRLASLAGLAVGATAIATFDPAGQGTAVPVLLSALLGPAYAGLMLRGVLAAPAESLALARHDRAAVLAEA